MAELSANEWGRAANDAIAAWKRDMAKPAKKLGEACNQLVLLEKKKTLTDEEKKKQKECMVARDSIRSAIVAMSKDLDLRLQSFKVKKDIDEDAFMKVQGQVGSLLKDGWPLSEHFSLTVKPLKLKGVSLVLNGKFRR